MIQKFSITKFNPEPILILRFPQNPHLLWSAEALEKAMLRELEQSITPISIVIDLTMSEPSVEDVVTAVNEHVRRLNPWTHHKNLREINIVTDNLDVYLASKNLGTGKLRRYRLRVHRTIEEALSFIRNNVRETAHYLN